MNSSAYSRHCHHRHHHWAAVVSRGWARASSCVSKSVCLVQSLPDRVAPVFVQVVSPTLGWSLLSSFLVIWAPSGNTHGPSVVFEMVDMPCPGPFHFSHIADYIYDFCLLPDPDIGLSILVCDVEHTSFHFDLCSRKFVMCLFGQCLGLCTIYVSAESTHELYTCLFR